MNVSRTKQATPTGQTTSTGTGATSRTPSSDIRTTFGDVLYRDGTDASHTGRGQPSVVRP